MFSIIVVLCLARILAQFAAKAAPTGLDSNVAAASAANDLVQIRNVTILFFIAQETGHE